MSCHLILNVAKGVSTFEALVDEHVRAAQKFVRKVSRKTSRKTTQNPSCFSMKFKSLEYVSQPSVLNESQSDSRRFHHFRSRCIAPRSCRNAQPCETEISFLSVRPIVLVGAPNLVSAVRTEYCTCEISLSIRLFHHSMQRFQFIFNAKPEGLEEKTQHLQEQIEHFYCQIRHILPAQRPAEAGPYFQVIQDPPQVIFAVRPLEIHHFSLECYNVSTEKLNRKSSFRSINTSTSSITCAQQVRSSAQKWSKTGRKYTEYRPKIGLTWPII